MCEAFTGWGTVNGFNLECWKFRYTTLVGGICATLNSRIQELKGSEISKQDIYLKDVILAL